MSESNTERVIDSASAEEAAHPTADARVYRHRLVAVREELDHLEALLCGGHHRVSAVADTAAEIARGEAGHPGELGHRMHVPAWLRATRGESRWPVAAVIVVAIGLQTVLPDRLTLSSHWLLPGLELALLLGLVVANPGRLARESSLVRMASLTLTGLLGVANAWSAAQLAAELITGHAGQDAAALLSTGAAIWLTNIISFALWYWQFDRGGPAARAHARRPLPDFQFPQMQDPARFLDWEPTFLDYLYLSFTNATAFSPTDVMPLSRWAKMTMLGQSLVSLITIALVVARAVNILK